jgi:hypothetical protein
MLRKWGWAVVTREMIWKSANKLDAEGVKPTLVAVRKRVGGGSFRGRYKNSAPVYGTMNNSATTRPWVSIVDRRGPENDRRAGSARPIICGVSGFVHASVHGRTVLVADPVMARRGNSGQPRPP